MGLSWGFLAGFQGLFRWFGSCIGGLFQGIGSRQGWGCPAQARAGLSGFAPSRKRLGPAGFHPSPNPQGTPCRRSGLPTGPLGRAEGYAAARRPGAAWGAVRLFAPFLARARCALAKPARQPPSGDVRAASLVSHSVTCLCNSKCPLRGHRLESSTSEPPPCRPGGCC